MQFDFDTPVNRSGTDSFKWRVVEGTDALPMWVADMDFASPPCVIDALRRRVDHGVFGYAHATNSVVQAVVDWCAMRYGWSIEPGWIVWLPGLVQGLHVACLACAEAGQEVATFTPVYPHLTGAPKVTGRQSLRVPLLNADGHWTMDLDALRAAITDNTRLLLLCHPHNPVGRAWRRGELEALGELCLKHDLAVCSDEIHCDLVLDQVDHVPLATLGPDLARRTITLMSAAKTFNIAGLNCGFAIISDDNLRRRFEHAAAGIVPHPNALGYAATEAALREGEPWRRELIDYLRGNRDHLERFVADHLPQLSVSHVEATYLAWIDARRLDHGNPHGLFRQAGVELSPGAMFHGQGFVRLNFACPRSALTQGLQRIRQATKKPQ